MFEVLPNWHPILVHYTVALLSVSVFLHVVVVVMKDAPWRGSALTVARWSLGLGAAITVGTIAAGLLAAGSVDHDDASHIAMTSHRNFALPTAGLFGVLALVHWYKFRGTAEPNRFFVAALVIAWGLLAVTAGKGGELVYRHGLGVLSLPEVSGEGHEHAPGEGHDEPDAMPDGGGDADHEHDEGEGHDETVEPEAAASDDGHNHIHAADLASEGPAGAVNAFHAAMRSGDGEATAAFLAANVMIFEGGRVERSRDEYEGGHMISDIAFVSQMSDEVTSQTEHVMGDMAMVLTESRTTGTFREREINSISIETAILHNTGDGWKIIHLHWGSRAAGDGH